MYPGPCFPAEPWDLCSRRLRRQPAPAQGFPWCPVSVWPVCMPHGAPTIEVGWAGCASCPHVQCWPELHTAGHHCLHRHEHPESPCLPAVGAVCHVGGVCMGGSVYPPHILTPCSHTSFYINTPNISYPCPTHSHSPTYNIQEQDFIFYLLCSAFYLHYVNTNPYKNIL